MVALKGVNSQIPILGDSTSPLVGYLFGGAGGQDFLVRACGCDQPRAGRGVSCPGVQTQDSITHYSTKTIRY